MALRAGYYGVKRRIKDKIETIAGAWDQTIASLFLRSEQAVLGAKNLLPNNAVSTTIFTVNDDKSVTVNTGGALAEQKILLLYDGLTLNEDVILSGCPSGGSDTTYAIYAKDTNNAYYWDYNSGGKLIPKGKTIAVNIVLRAGQNLSNLTFYPMLRLASDPDSTYVPYVMTNKELTVSLNTKISKTPTFIASTDDLNNVLNEGWYKWQNAPTNSPELLTWANMSVTSNGDVNRTQTVVKGGYIYQRTRTGTVESQTWGSWYKFTGTEVTPSSLTSLSPEDRSLETIPEETEIEEPVKKTTRKKSTAKADTKEEV